MKTLDTIEVTRTGLRQEVDRLKTEGYRFVTITCLEVDETFLEFIYHFDKDLQLVHLRLRSPKADPMPSISPSFFAAFLVENEILDQFGTRFEDLVLDFGGTLYLDEDDEITATPFCKFGVKKA